MILMKNKLSLQFLLFFLLILSFSNKSFSNIFYNIIIKNEKNDLDKNLN